MHPTAIVCPSGTGCTRQSAMLPGARTSQVPRRVSEGNPAAVPD